MRGTLEERVEQLEKEVSYLIALMRGIHKKTGLLLKYLRPKPKVREELICPECDSSRIRIVYKNEWIGDIDFCDCTICSTVFHPSGENEK